MTFTESTKSHAKRVVDYAGRLLQLDIYYFLRGGFWLTTAQITESFAALLIFIAFTRLATKEFFGTYQFVLMIISTISICALPGMSDAVAQAVARGKERTLITTTRMRFTWSFLGSLVLFILSAYFKYIQPKEFWWIFALLAIFFPFFYSFDSYYSFYLGKKKFGENAKRVILNRIVNCALTLAALYFTQSLFLVVITGLMVDGVFNYVFYKQITRLPLRKEDPNAVHYGLHLNTIRFISIISTYADKFIVTYFLGLEQLALYIIANALPEGLKNLMKLSTPLMLPKLAQKANTWRYSQLRAKVFLSLGINVVLIIIALILTPFVVNLFFTKEYAPVIPYAQIIFLSLLFMLPSLLFSTMLQAKKQVNALYINNLTFTGLQVVIVAILTSYYGILGASISRVAVRFLNTVQLWILARKL